MATAGATGPGEKLVEFNIQGNARTITLNRGAKLNALNTEMCREMIPRLMEFSNSKGAKLILIKSNSEKSFCSGGDVVACAKHNMAGRPEKSVEFFQNEYNLNYLLSIYGKPVVSLVNGIVMGGGVGLSVHNSFRVVTETTRFAMPESSIGFISDVGTSFWLPKLDSNLGYYLSLTGDELTGFDTLLMGFGTHYVPSNRFSELAERLSTVELADLAINRKGNKIFNNAKNGQLFALVNSIIEEFVVEVPKNHRFKYSNAELNTVERCFNPDNHKTVEDIITSLNEDGSEFAIKTIEKLNSKSPLSLNLNWNLLLRNKDATIQESLTRELKVAAKLMNNYRDNDFNDFIGNKLIAKNPAPMTSKYYKSIKDVPSPVVDELVSLDVYNPKSLSTDEVKAKEDAEKLIESLNGLKISNFPKLGDGVSNFNQYPHHMGLPTQSEIAAFVKEVEEGSRDSQSNKTPIPVTYRDTLNYFRMKYNEKEGVDAKVKMVLNRKTRPSTSDPNYIEWVD